VGNVNERRAVVKFVGKGEWISERLGGRMTKD